MEALEKLRELCFRAKIEGYVPGGCVAMLGIADEIERELSERYMELPCDADGEPIHIGDELETDYGRKVIVWYIGEGEIRVYQDSDYNRISQDVYAFTCSHVKPRTDDDGVCSKDQPKTEPSLSDEHDSREKLEADVRKMVTYSTSTLMSPPSANKVTEMLPSVSVDTVIGWLDRQAAITEREVRERLHVAQSVCRLDECSEALEATTTSAVKLLTDNEKQAIKEEIWGKDCDKPLDDLVHHPSHYTSGDIECIDAIRASMSLDEFRGFLKGQVFKYMWRYDKKDKMLQDLEKARWYLDKLHEIIEKNPEEFNKLYVTSVSPSVWYTPDDATLEGFNKLFK